MRPTSRQPLVLLAAAAIVAAASLPAAAQDYPKVAKAANVKLD